MCLQRHFSCLSYIEMYATENLFLYIALEGFVIFSFFFVCALVTLHAVTCHLKVTIFYHHFCLLCKNFIFSLISLFQGTVSRQRTHFLAFMASLEDKCGVCTGSLRSAGF